MWEHDGRQFARVSAVILPFKKLFVNTSSDERVALMVALLIKKKAVLGTMVHEAIKDDIEQRFPVLTEKAKPYYDSFCKWREKANPDLCFSELRLYCYKKMITGCVDNLVRFPGEDGFVLVDYKTAVTKCDSWILQGHLYHYLLKENGFHLSPRMLFVKLKKTGSKPTVYEYAVDPEVTEKCMVAIDDFWKNEQNK